MNKFRNLFGEKKALIGMIHTAANPGTFKHKTSVKEIVNSALAEAKIYEKYGFETVMIENMHDLPYLNRDVGHEVSTLMSIIGYEIKEKTNLNCGIQILAGANKQALASAKAGGLDFIRAESYVFSHIADEGIMHSDAGELKRYQKMIHAEEILIFTDVKKKHSSHSITSDIHIKEYAKAAEFFLSDALIVTGASTGIEANVEDVNAVIDSVTIPVLIGSGIDICNFEKYFKYCDGFIIGSHFKVNGYWANEIDENRVKKFMEAYLKYIS